VLDDRVFRGLRVGEKREGPRDLSQQAARVEVGRKESLGRFRRRWKDKITMGLKEIG